MGKRKTVHRKLYPVHEHMEFVMEHSTPEDRLRWLEDMQEMVAKLERSSKKSQRKRQG